MPYNKRKNPNFVTDFSSSVVFSSVVGFSLRKTLTTMAQTDRGLAPPEWSVGEMRSICPSAAIIVVEVFPSLYNSTPVIKLTA